MPTRIAGSRGVLSPPTPETRATRSAADGPAAPKGHAATDQLTAPRSSWTDRLGGAGPPRLKPFPDYYPQARQLPRLPGGDTLDTFDEAQVQALHRAYYAAPATASLADMIALACRDPAFASRSEPVTEKQVGRMMAKLPASFPWGWRSRILAATSHAVIGALLAAPRGTPVTEVLARLGEQYPDFPGYAAFRKATETWAAEPERFPFAKLLPSEGGRPLFAAAGEVAGLARDRLGRLVIDRRLADTVATLAHDPRVRYEWGRDDFIAFVDEAIGGGFSRSTYALLLERFGADHGTAASGHTVPSFTDIRIFALEKVCLEIARLFREEGLRDAASILRRLHDDHGYPEWPVAQLAFFRKHYPELVPELRVHRIEAAYAEAEQLLVAIEASPDQDLLAVGRALGLTDRRVGNLITLIRKRWPERLPKLEAHERYTPTDVAALRRVVEESELNATWEDLYRTVGHQCPELAVRHPLGSSSALASVVRRELGIDSWARYNQRRYSQIFADVVRRSGPGATFESIVNFIIDEFPGAYSVGAAKKVARLWREQPEEFPEIAALARADGTFPWQHAKTTMSSELADAVARVITANPKTPLARCVAILKQDEQFAATYPNFSVHTIHALRLAYPDRVPLVDGLQIHGRDRRVAAWGRAADALAARAARAAAALDDAEGLTVAALARTLGAKPHSVLTAIRRNPELFPWYRERPAGTVDEYLATRVGAAMESAPLGTTLQQIVAALQAESGFRARYPAFNYWTVTRLRERYPQLVPDWATRDQILRSKLIVDALLAAPRGSSFASVIAKVQAAHPDQITGIYASPTRLAALWQTYPERFPFAAALTGPRGGLRLEGHGRPLPVTHEADATLASRLARLDHIPVRLPLVDKIAAQVHQEYFSGFEVVAVQHLLDSQVPTFAAYRRLGMKPSRTTVIGVPYSSSPAVVDTLADGGWDVRVPPLDMETWVSEVRDAVRERLAAAKQAGRMVIALDDGGIVSQIIATDPELQQDAARVRLVEQTRRGITVAEGVTMRSALVNVAQSWGKYVEGPMIGSDVSEVALKRLARIGTPSVAGKKVGVIGAGTIGLQLARALRDAGAEVTLLDIDPQQAAAAEKAGFTVVLGDAATQAEARARFFAGHEIIIGSTGVRSITAADFAALPSRCTIGSASSKLVEIDVESLLELSKTRAGKPCVEIVDAQSHPPTVRYTLDEGRTVTLLARGFPLNFDGGPENIPPDRIQLTRALMLVGALQAAGARVAGINRLDPDLQLEVLSGFRALEGDAVAREKDQREALSLAELRLQEAKRHRTADDRRHGSPRR